jgi:hypothetical protein
MRNSPSRLRFRPLSQLTVRFRVELRRSVRDEGWQGVRRARCPVCRTRRTSASSSQAAVDRFLLARSVQRAFERTFAALDEAFASARDE